MFGHIEDQSASMPVFNITNNINKLMYLAVKINDKKAIALPDTGSQCSVMSRQTASELQLDIKRVDSKTIKPYASDTIKVEGEVLASVSVANKVIPTKFLVVNGFDECVLLGTDFLHASRMAVDVQARKVTVNGKSIAKLVERSEPTQPAAALDHHSRCFTINNVRCGHQQDPRHQTFRVKVRCLESTTIKAKSTGLVPIECAYYGVAEPVLIKNKYRSSLLSTALVLPSQVITTDTSAIHLINSAPYAIRLPKNHLVALARKPNKVSVPSQRRALTFINFRRHSAAA